MVEVVTDSSLGAVAAAVSFSAQLTLGRLGSCGRSDKQPGGSAPRYFHTITMYHFWTSTGAQLDAIDHIVDSLEYQIWTLPWSL